jgi:hypothetical protein
MIEGRALTGELFKWIGIIIMWIYLSRPGRI